MKSTEGQHSPTVCCIHGKRKWGGGGAYQHLLGNAQLFFGFFFLEKLKITVVASVENRVPGEQKWRETFPYLTLLNLKLCELETKN